MTTVAARSRMLLAVLATLLATAVSVPAARAEVGPPAGPGLRDVLLVGNNWDGTADVLDVPTYKRLDRINIVPDLQERMTESLLPWRLPFVLFVRTLVGEGHDQMVDDLYASKDGKTLFVSRPSFDDVVAIDLATRKIVWRTVLTGVRADHMAISPDGARLAVSTAAAAGDQVVDVLDTATGKMVGTFPSGDTPHENNFSRDGSLIFHASIGRVYTPTDDPALDVTKGTRIFEIVDAHTLKVLRKMDMSKKLEEFGRPGMSSAVRPMALSPDEKFLYFQVSFFHGFVEYDLERDKVTRVADLPVSAEAQKLRRDEYILDSAHHGIAMNGEGTKLCVAGTMSNYAAIVHRDDFSYRIHPLGARTYWSTTSRDGKYCYVSVAGDDSMSIISFDTEEEVARVPVGDHPQRARTAQLATSIFGEPAAQGVAGFQARSMSLRARPARDRRAPFRFALSGQIGLSRGVRPAEVCTGIARIDVRRGTTVVARGAARLRPAKSACTYATSIRIPARAARGSRRSVHLIATARFAGNGKLARQRSTQVHLRVR